MKKDKNNIPIDKRIKFNKYLLVLIMLLIIAGVMTMKRNIEVKHSYQSVEATTGLVFCSLSDDLVGHQFQ